MKKVILMMTMCLFMCSAGAIVICPEVIKCDYEKKTCELPKGWFAGFNAVAKGQTVFYFHSGETNLNTDGNCHYMDIGKRLAVAIYRNPMLKADKNVPGNLWKLNLYGVGTCTSYNAPSYCPFFD